MKNLVFAYFSTVLHTYIYPLQSLKRHYLGATAEVSIILCIIYVTKRGKYLRQIHFQKSSFGAWTQQLYLAKIVVLFFMMFLSRNQCGTAYFGSIPLVLLKTDQIQIKKKSLFS